MLNGSTPSEGLYPTDFDLRPEGKQGPLARSLAGYEQYYERWAQAWERQALLRGRVAAGDAAAGRTVRRPWPGRFLARELTDADEREIRRLKARMERERIPAGDDPDFHLKLGRGGLSDVEWTVQLLQLRHQVLGYQGTLAGPRRAAGRPGSCRSRMPGPSPTPTCTASGPAAGCTWCGGRRATPSPSRPEQLGPLARSLGTTGPGAAGGVPPRHPPQPGRGRAPVLRAAPPLTVRLVRAAPRRRATRTR